MFSGILAVDKPLGMTSHDVVSVVRRLLGIRAVGHTGTLDPAASGVMIVCLGRATKFARFFEVLDKSYWTVLQLGVCTDTQDATGTVVNQAVVPAYAFTDLQRVLERFRGQIQQTPPMYSAVKYHGQRLYRLARRGQTVIRQAREVCIRRLELLDFRHAQMTLSITCSKGTYIRTLGEDIGMALGCGAHVLYLQRCRVGAFTQQNTWALEDIAGLVRTGDVQQAIVPLTEALSFLPSLQLSPHQCHVLQAQPGGLLPTISQLLAPLPQHISSYRLCDESQRTVAVAQRHLSLYEGWKIYVTS